MQGRTLEQMSTQMKTYLANQSRQGAMNVLLASLRDKNPVETLLEPPRVAVTIAANDPTKGPADAPVQVLEFSDFQ
jgi:protein-disulfide isomerase